jgi:hypothetical protein
MARVSMAMKLTEITQETPEGVQVFAKDNSWTSSGGGCFPVQSGVWNQLPSGPVPNGCPKTTGKSLSV